MAVINKITFGCVILAIANLVNADELSHQQGLGQGNLNHLRELPSSELDSNLLDSNLRHSGNRPFHSGSGLSNSGFPGFNSLGLGSGNSSPNSGFPGFNFPGFGSNNGFTGLGFPGFNFPGFGSGGSSSNPGFPGFNFPGFPSFPGFPGGNRPTTVIPTPPSPAPIVSTTEDTEEPSTVSDRERRDVENSADNEESQPQNRLFFTRFPTITSCNSTTEAGSSCRTCSQALRCFSNNFGLLTTCRGLFRHCNNGRCSITQSAECSTTAASITTTPSDITTTISG